MWSKVSLVVLVLTVAGCMAPQTSVPSALDVPAIAGPSVAVDGSVATNGTFRFASDVTVGSDPHPRGIDGLALCLMDKCPDPSVECSPSNCERRRIDVEVPDGWWQDHDGFLEFSIRWPTVFDNWFQIYIEDAAGARVAVGQSGYMSPVGLVAKLDRPSTGQYVAVVVHVAGSVAYEGVVQLESSSPAEARDLLPNLITLPPTDLTFDDPPAEGPGYLTFVPRETVAPAHQALGSRGCATEEAAAQQARRCLRFSNAVGNLGEGVLEIRLPLEEGATSAAGGAFVQRVYRSDGSFTERAAGGAEFHAMHAHWHNAAANRYAVYAHDEATGARGELFKEGRKAGVCFADIGLIDLGLEGTRVGRFSGAPCLNPALSNDWYMGLSPNWYDNYYWILVDQYVEMTGATDGVYELCSQTNQDAVLLESDYSDNEGCTLFRLTGDDIEVLSENPYHRTPDGAGPT